MVISQLNPKINYPEIKKLDDDDIDYDSTTYEIDILGTNVIIAIGKGKNTFSSKNILYYPIYLIKKNKVFKQIGIFEVKADELSFLLDDEGDLDIEKLDYPLLYSFVTKDMLLSSLAISDEEKREEEKEEQKGVEEAEEELSEEPNPLEKKEEDLLSEISKMQSDYPVQNKENAMREHNEYKVLPGQPWIQTFLENNYFSIKDNEGGGDCLFAVIRDAFRSRGKYIEVIDLRKKLSQEVNEDILKIYKERYEMFSDSIKTAQFEGKKLVKANDDLKRRLELSRDSREQAEIIAESKKNVKLYEKIKNEIKMSKEMLSDFEYMKNINTLEEFKLLVESCDFWADTWTISTLERILNIKLIILSSNAFRVEDKANVMQCGEKDPKIDEVFEPDFYIMTEYTGNHYKLIKYREQGLFVFREIPFDIKILITEKCLEKNAGLYASIPQFNVFREEELGIKLLEEDEKREEIDLVTSLTPLYDDDIIFQFYEKSDAKPKPGLGAGEKIPKSDILEYANLGKIINWRRKLANNWTKEDTDGEKPLFDLDGHKWLSVEHYIQGSKYKKDNNKFYLMFSLDSGSDLSKDVEMAKAVGEKDGKYKGKQVRPKDVKEDNDYLDREREEIEKAQYAKYSQNEDLKEVLIETKNAKLVGYKRGQPPVTMIYLMNVRQKLSKTKK